MGTGIDSSRVSDNPAEFGLYRGFHHGLIFTPVKYRCVLIEAYILDYCSFSGHWLCYQTSVLSLLFIISITFKSAYTWSSV